MKRFSIAFLLGASVHFIGTVMLVWAALRILFADIFSSKPVPFWFDALGATWLSLPTLLAHVVPDYYFSHQTFFLVLWSLCVGTIVGFLVRSHSAWKRQIA